MSKQYFKELEARCSECNGKLIGKNELFCSICGIVDEESSIKLIPSFTNQQLPTFSAGGITNYKKKHLKEVILADKKEVTFMNFKVDVERICQQLKLATSVQHDALKFLNQVVKNRLASGRDFDAVIGACVFLASKRFDLSINVIDLAEYCLVDLKSLENCIEQLNEELKINLNNLYSGIRFHLIRLFDKRILSKSELLECLKTVDNLRITDFSPRLKAICIAFVIIRKNDSITIEEFCSKLKISQRYLSKAYDKINGGVIIREWQKIKTYT